MTVKENFYNYIRKKVKTDREKCSIYCSFKDNQSHHIYKYCNLFGGIAVHKNRCKPCKKYFK
jgi:hypothetical protein